jgi:hypothetical protein
MSDRDHWELCGPLRTADIHRTWRYWKRGSGESAACELTENGDQSIVEFRPDGTISRHWHRNPDGSEITETHEYDPASHLASTQFEGSTGPTHLRLYEYDSLGRLTRQLSRDAEGNDHTSESYSYDAQGLKTKTHFAPQLPNYHYAIDGSKAFYSAPNAATIITNYDDADRPTELLFQDASGALLSRVELHYDASGHLTEEAQTQIAPPLTAHLQEQLNPEQMALVQSVLAGPITRLLHRYDSVGNRIETLRSLFGSRSEARFRYEYDSHGNWTSKITEGRHDDTSDFSVTTTERRTLTYFDPI